MEARRDPGPAQSHVQGKRGRLPSDGFGRQSLGCGGFQLCGACTRVGRRARDPHGRADRPSRGAVSRARIAHCGAPRGHRVPVYTSATTAYIALMNESGECPDFLPKCYSGGAPVAPSLTDRFEARFGTYIHNIYGLTESASPTHATPLGARAPVDPVSGALSIGVPIP